MKTTVKQEDNETKRGVGRPPVVRCYLGEFFVGRRQEPRTVFEWRRGLTRQIGVAGVAPDRAHGRRAAISFLTAYSARGALFAARCQLARSA